jgi:small subunit ribosomal protein S16
MLMIRLQRTGKKHDPSFRVVLIDSRRAAKSGSVLEILGDYNAVKKKYNLDTERIKNLISKGAQVSDTIHNYLVKEKIIGGKKRDVLRHAKIKAKLAQKAPKEPAAEPTPTA